MGKPIFNKPEEFRDVYAKSTIKRSVNLSEKELQLVNELGLYTIEKLAYNVQLFRYCNARTSKKSMV